MLTSHDADPHVSPAVPPGFSSAGDHRFYAEAAVQGTLTIVMAEPLRARRLRCWKAARALSAPLLALVPLELPWRVAAGARQHAAECGGFAPRSRRAAAAICGRCRPGDCRPRSSRSRLRWTTDGRVAARIEPERNSAAKSAHGLAIDRRSMAIPSASLPSCRMPRRWSAPEQVEETLRGLARLAEKLMQSPRRRRSPAHRAASRLRARAARDRGRSAAHDRASRQAAGQGPKCARC